MDSTYNTIGKFHGWMNTIGRCHFPFGSWSNNVISKVSISKDENLVSPVQMVFGKVTMEGASDVVLALFHESSENQGCKAVNKGRLALNRSQKALTPKC